MPVGDPGCVEATSLTASSPTSAVEGLNELEAKSRDVDSAAGVGWAAALGVEVGAEEL